MQTVKEGGNWTLKRYIAHGEYAYQSYSVNCDTMIGPLNFKKVWLASSSSPSLIGYVREDSLHEKIYYRSVDSSSETLVVDFTLMPGDSFYFHQRDYYARPWIYSSGYAYVDSVKQVIIEGKLRKVIYLGGYKMVEGLGFDNSGIIYWSLFMSLDRVLQLESCGEWGHPYYSKNPALLNYIIQPNPSSGAFYLEFNDDVERTYSVYSACGKKISRGIFRRNTNIDMGLSKGLYFLQVSGAQIKKIVVH